MKATRGARASFVLLATLGVVALACSSSTTSSASAAAPDASSTPSCSTGPAIAEGTKLPNVAVERDAAPCVPRCGYDTTQTRSGFYFMAALPSGACNDEPVCSLRIYDGCGHHGAQCECVNGEWSCGISSRARVVCLDAGADESADASTD